MKLTLFCSALVGLLFAGCAGTESLPPEPPQLPVPGVALLQEAVELETRGVYETAYIRYNEALSELEDPVLSREAMLARARTLFEMRRYGAALAALSPMPELPASLYDCRKMALASRILQKMNVKPEYVEALMEVALDNNIEETGVALFKADGYADLGRIYIANEKVEKAAKCFEYAAELYERNGNTGKANACRNIRDYLK